MPRHVSIFLTLLVSLLAGISMPAEARILVPEGNTAVPCHPSGNYSHPFHNTRGDVMAEFSAAGNIISHTSRDADGLPLDTFGAATSPYGPNGKWQEPGGLINDGFRHRDPHTATFLSRDPAGFIDGPNTYNYVGHNPWSAFDPHGLASNIPVTTAEIGYVQPDITTNPDAGLPPLVGNDFTPAGLPTLTQLLSRFGDLFIGLVGLSGEISAGLFNLITSADITSAPAEYDLMGGGFYLGEERPRGERYASFALVALSYGRGGSFMDDFVRAGTKGRSFAGTAAKPWVSGTGGEASGTLRRFLQQDEFNAIQAAIRNGDESVSLGRYFTPDNISDANVATMQLALPGTRANPIVGFVDVPRVYLPSSPLSSGGPRLVDPFTGKDGIRLPGLGLEVEFATKPIVPTSGLNLVPTP